MIKKSALIMLAFTVLVGLGSCKFIKEKFSKNKEITPIDSTESGLADGGLGESTTDTSFLSSTSGNVDTSLNTTTAATNSESSTESTSSASSGSSTTASAAPDNGHAKTAAKSSSTSSSTNSSTSIASTTSSKKTTVAEIDEASKTKKRRVSTSIYDGINDQEERMVIRKAEGYNDYYYVDDYNGSNTEYENHYKLASKLDGSKDYVVPASGSASRQAAPVAAKAKPQPAPQPQPAPEAPRPEVKKTSESHIGDVPKKVATPNTDKPKSASDIIKKK